MDIRFESLYLTIESHNKVYKVSYRYSKNWFKTFETYVVNKNYDQLCQIMNLWISLTALKICFKRFKLP